MLKKNNKYLNKIKKYTAISFKFKKNLLTTKYILINLDYY